MYEGPRTLGAVLQHRAAEQPDREIVRFDDGSFTYRQLQDQAQRVANALADLGLGKGDRVAIQLPNGPEFLASWFGIALGGYVEVPLNVGLRGDLLAHVLNLSEARAVIVSAEWAERIAAIAPGLPALVHVIVVGAGGAIGTLNVLPFSDLLSADGSAPRVDVSPYDTSVLLLTSGTTGPSKGVVLTHNANFAVTDNVISLMEYTDDERLFSAFPLFHVNAKYCSVLPAMVMDNGALLLHSRFSASRFWDICREFGATGFNFMGALILMLYKQPERDDDFDNPVCKGYGAPAPPAITPAFEGRFGVRLFETYGSTELGVCIGNTPSARKIGSCGKALAPFEVEIHDEHGYRVAPDEIGEIVVRPRAPHIIVEEYFRMPEATAAAFSGLWFHTGDRGRCDADGWFQYVDRTKDAIRRRGENISSWEVEQVLNSHECVAESAVVGVPSELTEEEVYAIVVLKEGQELEPTALLDFAQQALPHFAVPRYVSFVTDLPRNQQQRIQKFMLRDAGLAADAWDRESVGYVVAR